VSHLWWYVARSSGIVTWVLLTASTLWGLALSTKVMGRRVRSNWLLDLHRFLGGAGVVFLATHLLSLVADSYTHYGPTDLLVPFVSGWHTTTIGLAVVATYLLVAVEVTSLLRRRLPTRLWRMTHLLSFPLYLFATVHGLADGTDIGNRPLRFLMVGSLGAVGALTCARLPWPRRDRRPAPVPTAAAASPTRLLQPVEIPSRPPVASAGAPPALLDRR
jgi:predicted ferric reductase